MNIVGLDLSLTATGIAHADGSTATVKTKTDRGDQRLDDIYEAVLLAIRDADHVIIEDLPFNAMQAGTTGMVQGVARHTIMVHEIPYTLVPAATLKVFATGSGRADKEDMREALRSRTGTYIKDNNQVDAAWLRQMGLVHFGGSDALTLPQTHLRALDKIKWG